MKSKRKSQPKIDPLLKVHKLIRFKARPYDWAAIKLLMEKGRHNQTTAIRIALARNADFEGLRSEVEEKARLLVLGGEVSA